MTPIEQVAQWIEDKPVWWKHAVRLTLRHGILEQIHLDEIYHIARVEHFLEPHTPISIAAQAPADFSGFTNELNAVNLVGLSNVKGVGILAEDQNLKLPGNGLFIVYGDNGAGKSSYASILKSACLTRGDRPQIIGNVFAAENPEPEATITVAVDGTNQTLNWKPSSQSNHLLKAIRVFDSSSAHHYVNKEDVLGFKPVGLNILTELTKAINQLKAIVSEDILPGNGLIRLEALRSNTPAALFVNNLSSNSKESELEQFAAAPHEFDRIESLRKELYRDRMQTAETKKASLHQQRELLAPLFKRSFDILRYLGDKALSRLSELQLDYADKQQKADELKTAIIDDLPLETVAGVSWKVMWDAARSFVQQEPKSIDFPPIKGDTCPICLQDIDAQSERRLKSLSSFLANSAAKEADEALKLVNNAINMISSQFPSLSEHTAALIEVEKLIPNSGERFHNLYEQLSKRKALLLTPANLPSSIDTLDTSVLAELRQQIESITAEHDTLRSDADLLRIINKKEADLQLLKDKKFIQDHHSSILRNIHRYKVINKMEALGRQCNTKQVSTLVSAICKDGLVTPLLKAFRDELKQFGFTHFSVKAKTRTKGANQQLKLVIQEGGEPLVSKIASEGEQRCIAIAAFLAEMKVDHRKSAVIFDDPVNSLSHQWRSRVANRLVAESTERQVVVFTHDIVFYKLLLEAAERRQASHSSSALERSRKNLAGIVRDNPPWEALTTSKRVRALTADLQNVRRIDKNGTDDAFRRASREFYGRLRESWERLVEEKLLNKVVNRFERSIQTQRLKRLTDITDADVSKIDEAMHKCSTYFTGHDSAPSIGDPYPTMQELEDDLSQLNEFLMELNLRKRS